MRFSELVKESILLLKESERLTYRALQREFDIDAETLEDLKIELVKARKVAVDEGGEILVWVGDGAMVSAQPALKPIAYTPSHLADRIRAATGDGGARRGGRRA